MSATPDPYYLQMRDSLKANLTALEKALKLSDDDPVLQMQVQVMQMQLQAVEHAIDSGTMWDAPESVKELVISELQLASSEVTEIMDEVDEAEQAYQQGYCYELFLTKKGDFGGQDCIDFFNQWPLTSDDPDTNKRLARQLVVQNSIVIGSSNDPEEIKQFLDFCRSGAWKDCVIGAAFHYLNEDKRLENPPVALPFYGANDQAVTLAVKDTADGFSYDDLCDIVEKRFPYLTPAQAMELASSMFNKRICIFASGRRDLIEPVAIALYEDGLNVRIVQTSGNVKRVDANGIWKDPACEGGLLIGDAFVPMQ
jgi:hypothetical protein